METLNIRPAERKDCVTIVELIKELAEYEKMLERALMTPEGLEHDAFDCNPPYFRCLVAELKESEGSAPRVIGYALYFHTYSTWQGKAIHLEDFYVTPKYRAGGIGTQLLKHLAKIAVDGGFARVTLECLDWNKSAIDYYKKLEAVDMTEKEGWRVFRFEKEVLPKLAGYEK